MMAALHLLQLSPWRRAPLLLLGSPAVVAAVAAAAAALVLVISSPTLFVSAVGGAAIRSDIVDGCPYGVGFSVTDHSPLPGTDAGARGFEARRTFLEDLGRRTPGTAAPVITLGSGPVDLETGRGGPGDGRVQVAGLVHRARSSGCTADRAMASGSPTGPPRRSGPAPASR